MNLTPIKKSFLAKSHLPFCGKAGHHYHLPYRSLLYGDPSFSATYEAGWHHNCCGPY
jgi:hypothetical protein